MIVLIAGATHTGKTALAQRLLDKYKLPYLSIDHLKMGLIRSGLTSLSVYDDDALMTYLWSVVKEIVKTAIENNQNLIVEGCYIPFNWEKDFEREYIAQIKYCCLIMSEKYILNNFSTLLNFENIIEKRLNSDISQEQLIAANQTNLQECKKYGLNYILIDTEYNVDIEL